MRSEKANIAAGICENRNTRKSLAIASFPPFCISFSLSININIININMKNRPALGSTASFQPRVPKARSVRAPPSPASVLHDGDDDGQSPAAVVVAKPHRAPAAKRLVQHTTARSTAPARDELPVDATPSHVDTANSATIQEPSSSTTTTPAPPRERLLLRVKRKREDSPFDALVVEQAAKRPRSLVDALESLSLQQQQQQHTRSTC